VWVVCSNWNYVGIYECLYVCSDEELEDKKALIVSGLKIILQESNLKVRAREEKRVWLGECGMEGGARHRFYLASCHGDEYVVCRCGGCSTKLS